MAVVETPQGYQIIARRVPGIRGVRLVDCDEAIPKFPNTVSSAALDQDGELQREPDRHIRGLCGDSHVQRAGDRAGMIFVAANRRRTGPVFAVNIRAADVVGVARPAAGRAGAQVRSAGQFWV